MIMWVLKASNIGKVDKEIVCFLLEHSNQPYMETIRIRRKPCISTILSNLLIVGSCLVDHWNFYCIHIGLASGER